MVIEITPMASSVCAAFFACGRRNAGTPSEMASTPVSAVAPDENARRRTHRLTDPPAVASSVMLWMCSA